MHYEKGLHLLQHLVLLQNEITLRNAFLFGDEQQLINQRLGHF